MNELNYLTELHRLSARHLSLEDHHQMIRSLTRPGNSAQSAETETGKPSDTLRRVFIPLINLLGK